MDIISGYSFMSNYNANSRKENFKQPREKMTCIKSKHLQILTLHEIACIQSSEIVLTGKKRRETHYQLTEFCIPPMWNSMSNVSSKYSFF